jgi:hypothetical protein
MLKSIYLDDCLISLRIKNKKRENDMHTDDMLKVFVVDMFLQEKKKSFQ